MEEPENLSIDQTNWGVTDGGSLFDVFEQDDYLLSCSAEVGLLDEKIKKSVEGENVFEPFESTEPDISRDDKHYLRQSLAWDSAFFTCAGVLDPDELSSIIERAVHSDSKTRQMLPGIQEDISQSTDSLSTLESDTVDLASLEADLFSDIRASIQRSGFTPVNSVKSEIYEGTESMGGHGVKVTDQHHGNIVKPKSTFKKPVTSLQGHEISKKLDSAGAQLVKPLGKSSESSSSILRQPATNSKTTSVAVARTSVSRPKRTPLAVDRVRSKSNNLGVDKARGGKVSNDSQPGNPRSMVSKPISSTKSSPGSAVTIKGSPSPRSSCDSSRSSSSENHHRTSSFSSLRKTDNKMVKLPSPSSQQKTPLPVVGLVKGRKVQAGTPPRPSARVKSSTKDGCCDSSPVSYVNERSSASSSLTVSGNQKKGSNISPDSSSTNNGANKDTTPTVLDLLVQPIEKTSTEYETGEAGKLQRTFAKKSAAAGNGSSPSLISVKPTGLRLPSRKNSFFDGEKTGGRTPVSGKQIRSCSTKSGKGEFEINQKVQSEDTTTLAKTMSPVH